MGGGQLSKINCSSIPSLTKHQAVATINRPDTQIHTKKWAYMHHASTANVFTAFHQKKHATFDFEYLK